MVLKKLFKDVKTDNCVPDINITHITHDSRKLQEGRDCLFVAVNGLDFDGHKFIGDAYKSGCRNFLVNNDRQSKLANEYSDANFISVEDTQKALPVISKNFYDDPSSKFKLIGITGTNGKTTTAFAVFSCLQKFGKKVGLIGTIEYRICDKIIPAPNTTPDALALNELINQMVKSGVEYLVMEVSSHALSLHRADGLNFDVVAFTNFTQDHLDYHKTMEEYLQAKLKIFDILAESCKEKKVAVVNRDTKQFSMIQRYNLSLNLSPSQEEGSYSAKQEEIKKNSSFPLPALPKCNVGRYRGEAGREVSFRTTSLENSGANYYANKIDTSTSVSTTVDRSIDVSKFILNTPVGSVPVNIAMTGKPNVYNFTMAFAILLELGFPKNDIVKNLAGIKVKGRMESVENNRGIGVIIDYAHTPDGLENLLRTVREIVVPDKKIITVFGAGGDRDKTKRPLMGKIASKLSDYIIITSDNPRTEDPMAIIKDVKSGISNNSKSCQNCKIIEDREKAIKQALLQAKKGDVVVIAGKGHEEYQIIGKEKRYFSDRKVICDLLR